jgi:tetratricopeptide (TPR) repeat protein
MRSDRRFQMITRLAPTAELASLEPRDDRDAGDAARLKADGFHELRKGDPERAAALFLRQYSLDSTATALYNAACAFAVAGREDRALALLERSIHAGYGDQDKLSRDADLKSLRDQPRFEQLVRVVSDLELQYPKGRQRTEEEKRAAWSRTLRHHERVAGRMPRSGRAWFNVGFAGLRAGDPEVARDAFQRALDTGYRRGATLYNIACAEAQIGNDDSALRHLRWAEQAGFDVDQMAPGDEDLEALRRNPTFRSMVARWEADNRRDKSPKHQDKSRKTTD